MQLRPACLCSCLSPDWRAFILFADILLSKFAMFVALMRRFVVEPVYPAAIPHMMFLGKCDFSQSFLPFHLEHYTERLGLIMIIMLGESIDGIAVNNEHQRGSTKMYAAVFLAFLLVSCCAILAAVAPLLPLHHCCYRCCCAILAAVAPFLLLHCCCSIAAHCCCCCG